jgi:hypothetical protein
MAIAITILAVVVIVIFIVIVILNTSTTTVIVATDQSQYESRDTFTRVQVKSFDPRQTDMRSKALNAAHFDDQAIFCVAVGIECAVAGNDSV